MKINKLTFQSSDFPEALTTIPSPPRVLYVAGNSLADLVSRPCVAIVGSRKVSPYGQAVTTRLAGELARAGVVIVSGLALGVDAIAHRAALDAGGLAIAVLPCGLDNICPRTNYGLAMDILRQGGALVSEHPDNTPMNLGRFIARNRLVSGLSQITLITEASAKSGTLHTAQFALEQGREVMAVPGNITSATSAGTNNLIKVGAAPVTKVTDIFDVLGIQPATKRALPYGDTPEQQAIIDLIANGEEDGTAILYHSKMDVSSFNQNLTMLEITGKVRSLGNNKWSLS
jgi:DNA processing protein